MRGIRNKLTLAKILRFGPGKYGDGAGLWLVKSGQNAGSWMLRVSVSGRLIHMGLGSIQAVSLTQAREEADRWRAVAQAGQNPIDERGRQQQQDLGLVDEIARQCFDARKADLKEDGRAGRWFSPLELHILPLLGTLPIARINQMDIRDALRPIWRSKAAIAEKALQRLDMVMRYGAALGHDVDLHACMKARVLLGGQGRQVEHIAAMRWEDVPAFYASLCDDSVTQLALRLLILTGVRSGPLRHLRVEHVVGDLWTIPASLTKGRRGRTKEFRVPLSPAAREVIARAKPHARDGFIFPGIRTGVISDATMARFMTRRGLEARPHGFRSSLRDWLAEQTDASREVAETMLEHVAGGQVERSYRRTDYFDRRRDLLSRWAAWVTGEASS